MAEHSSGSRNVGLDLLRLAAVVLVLGRHLPVLDLPWPVEAVTSTWKRGGWIGVDLFFVLSGFLVSGLLFGEYRKDGNVRVRRFLTRRWLRILPPFWLLIFVTAIYRVAHHDLPLDALASELLFLQNYKPRLWNHTWSLAVEEHFYLLTPFAVAMSLRFKRRRESEPFSWVAPAVAVVCVLCLLLRIVHLVVVDPASREGMLFPTHFRLDSLAVGVLMAREYHFERERFEAFFRRYRGVLVVIGAALVSPAFMIEVSHNGFIVTGGLTMIYIGCACLVGAAVVTDFGSGRLAVVAASIGASSYSIYLWHEPVLHWGTRALERVLGDPSDPIRLAFYVVGSLAFGVMAARLIEIPTLRVRDRLFPPTSGGTPAVAASPEAERSG